MADQSYVRLVDESKRKLADLKARRDELDVEMGKLRLLIFAGANMLPDDQRDEALEGVQEETLAQRVGITEAVRNALQPAWQRPMEIRDAVEAAGYDLAEYGNAMASIHTVLKRLVAAGQAETKSEDGKTLYRGTGHPLDKLRAPYRGEGLKNLAMLRDLMGEKKK